MTKKEIRSIYNLRRNQLTHSQKEKLDDLILIQFQQFILPHINTLLSFWPMTGKNEINTHIITDFIFFRNPGLQLAYPVTDLAACEMKAILTNDNTEFMQNEYLISEPTSGEELPAQEIDAILIPLLAFDERGYRVGYGKGFYDRYLPKCSKDVIKIGLSYFEPIDKIDDIDPNDVRMNYCITPDLIYQFHN
jgi:5-formyltetrahydrofolate cyclo-ligase